MFGSFFFFFFFGGGGGGKILNIFWGMKIFFKMGVSLGRPHWKRDIIRISNRWRRTGQQRVL